MDSCRRLSSPTRYVDFDSIFLHENDRCRGSNYKIDDVSSDKILKLIKLISVIFFPV